MKRAVEFYSEGFKLCGDIYVPNDLSTGEKRSGILLCHGYTGVKDLYLPDNARVLNEAGYVVMTFDYKGWGESEGKSPNRLAPHSRVADVQAAMTFLGLQPEVNEDNIGMLPDRQSAELAAAARKDNPAAVGTIPVEYVDDTIGFNPEWIVNQISPRPILFITSLDDRLVPPEESEKLYEHAGEPKKLVVLKGVGHYEVYAEPAFSEVMKETLDWYQTYLPAKG